MQQFKKVIALYLFLLSFLTLNAGQVVVLETTQGVIEIELMDEIAPKAVKNFTTHITNGYYDGLKFHRIIKGFMIQGGDPTGTGRGGESIWKKPFEDEVTEKVKFDGPGILAMANAGPNTNGSQFFITTAATPWLNGNHTIFGRVNLEHYSVLNKLESVETDYRDAPKKEQKIVKARLK